MFARHLSSSSRVILTAATTCLLWNLAGAPLPQERPGFQDTAYLPDGRWKVHDSNRPYPGVVVPGTASTPDTPGRAPSDAVVLFDGKDLSQWLGEGVGPNQGKVVEAAWRVENGYVEVAPETGSIFSKEVFGDCQIHVEWATPEKISGESQGRGNSGVLIMGKYEIQVLDSYKNVTYADGQASALYGQYPPLVNASLPPGTWQTYDIIFEAPLFDGDSLVKPAYATVLHNGIVTHHRQPFLGAMVYRKVATYTLHEAKGPLLLQHHDNPVRYRNIWVRPLGKYDQP